ncbi:Uncharacterised protein [uncultured archaeon]|nr:Uncharacterised protein [uncultured archaeon]
MRIFLSIAVLIMLASAAHGQDYLGGGYVASGDYGDIGQYFTDPIFTSWGTNYVSPDPAISGMQKSLDVLEKTSGTGRTASGTKIVYVPTGALPTSAVGGWHLELADNTVIDLILSQSQPVVFGRGRIISGGQTRWVTASGTFSGSHLLLNVVPASGEELYAITLKAGSLPLTASYFIYKSNSPARPGKAKTVLWSPLSSYP